MFHALALSLKKPWVWGKRNQFFLISSSASNTINKVDKIPFSILPGVIPDFVTKHSLRIRKSQTK